MGNDDGQEEREASLEALRREDLEDSINEEVELDFAELRIAELEAFARDVIFSCNEVLTADYAITPTAFAHILKRKAQVALLVQS